MSVIASKHVQKSRKHAVKDDGDGSPKPSLIRMSRHSDDITHHHRQKIHGTEPYDALTEMWVRDDENSLPSDELHTDQPHEEQHRKLDGDKKTIRHQS